MPLSNNMSHYQQPDASGHFGIFGGSFVSETLTHAILELREAYAKYQNDPAFLAEFQPVEAANKSIDCFMITTSIAFDRALKASLVAYTLAATAA